jgi:GNAT superfamily N-acetyltransferase
MKTYESTKENFSISTDKRKLNLPLIQDFLANRSYWAKGISMQIVKKCVQGSICFGVYEAKKQVGFARVISDCATFGYICDVFILEAYRGKELSKFLMETIMQCPDFQGFRRWQLATHDAHSLYAQYGFLPVQHPERAMEIVVKDIYLKDITH